MNRANRNAAAFASESEQDEAVVDGLLAQLRPTANESALAASFGEDAPVGVCADAGDAPELKAFLLELRSWSHTPVPPLTAAVADADRGDTGRRAWGRKRTALLSVAVIASLGLGVGAAAASPEIRATTEQVVSGIMHVFQPVSHPAPVPPGPNPDAPGRVDPGRPDFVPGAPASHRPTDHPVPPTEHPAHPTHPAYPTHPTHPAHATQPSRPGTRPTRSPGSGQDRGELGDRGNSSDAPGSENRTTEAPDESTSQQSGRDNSEDPGEAEKADKSPMAGPFLGLFPGEAERAGRPFDGAQSETSSDQ